MSSLRKHSEFEHTGSHARETAQSQLDRLQRDLDALGARLSGFQLTAASAVTPDVVRRVINARREREQLFDPDLFSDPAWDILLELFLARLTQRRVATTDVGLAAAVPPTTALRWIDKLERSGWIVRQKDGLDARRTFVELSAGACERMQFHLRGERVTIPDR